MKKKIFISLIISLCLVFGSTTVLADNSEPDDEYAGEYIFDREHIDDDISYDENIYEDESEYDEYNDSEYDNDGLVNFFEEYVLYDDNAYFLDTTGTVNDDTKNEIYDTIKNTADETENNIAVYISNQERSEEDIDSICEKGIEKIFLGDNVQSGEMVFFYFDLQSMPNIKISMQSTYRFNESHKSRLNYILDDMQGIADRYITDNDINRVIKDCVGRFCDEYADISDEPAQTLENSYDSDSYQRYYSGYAPTTYYQFDYYKDDIVYYSDESKRFTKDQKQKITDLLKDTSKKIGFNLAVYTAGYNRTDIQVENFTENGAMDIFGLDNPNGTVFLYIDLDGFSNAYDTMYCYHQPFLYYTSELFGNRIDKILEAMQKKFPKSGEDIYFEDIYAGLQEYCNQLIKYKEMGMEEGCYYYDTAIQRYITVRGGRMVQTTVVHWKLPLFIALIIGAMVFISVYFGVKQQYKFKSSTSASEYTSGNSTHLNVKNDIFLGSHITKVRIESSSGGHGGRHGSSFHGGGHSGGGGGGRHR